MPIVLSRVFCMKTSTFCDDAIVCYVDWREIIPTHKLPTVHMTVVQLCLCQLYWTEFIVWKSPSSAMAQSCGMQIGEFPTVLSVCLPTVYFACCIWIESPCMKMSCDAKKYWKQLAPILHKVYKCLVSQLHHLSESRIIFSNSFLENRNITIYFPSNDLISLIDWVSQTSI